MRQGLAHGEDLDSVNFMTMMPWCKPSQEALVQRVSGPAWATDRFFKTLFNFQRCIILIWSCLTRSETRVISEIGSPVAKFVHPPYLGV